MIRVALTISVLMLVSGGRAQQTTATFHAVVTDPTGGSVPEAAVTLSHDGTGAIAMRKTTALGEAIFDFLRVGSYTLRVEATGFKRLEIKGIELSAAQNVRQSYVLEIGATSETVSVEGSTPLINTVSSEQLNTFDSSK